MPLTVVEYIFFHKSYIVVVFSGISQHFNTIKFDCCYSKLVIIADFPMYPFQWYSLCFSVTLQSSSKVNAVIAVDGRYLDTRIKNKDLSDIDIDGQGSFIIGQDQDTFASSFDSSESFSGYIADFVFFSHTLPNEKLLLWTEESSTFDGAPLMSFNNLDDFEISKVRFYEETNFSTFKEQYYPFYRIFSNEVTFSKASNLCHTLGGTLVTPTSQTHNDELFELTSNSKELCSFDVQNHDLIWLGVLAEDPIENASRHYLLKSKLNFSYYHLNGDSSSQNSQILCTSSIMT